MLMEGTLEVNPGRSAWGVGWQWGGGEVCGKGLWKEIPPKSFLGIFFDLFHPVTRFPSNL